MESGLGQHINEGVTKDAPIALLAWTSLSLAIKMLSALLVYRGYLLMADLVPAFRGPKAGQSAPLASAIS